MATILLLDAHLEVSELFARVLREQGHTVLQADRIATALMLVDTGGVLDAIIVDGVLNDGHGIDFIEGLRERGRGTPVLFMSGYLQSVEGRVRLTDELGVARILAKPVSPNELLFQVAGVLGKEGVPELVEFESIDTEEVEATALVESLRESRDAYEVQLDAQLRRIAALVHKEGDPTAAWEEARDLAATVHDTAASFGFVDVGRLAGQLRNVLQDGLTTQHAGARARAVHLVAELSLTRRATRTGARRAGSGRAGSILLLHDDAKMRERLVELGTSRSVGVAAVEAVKEAIALVGDRAYDGVLVHVGRKDEAPATVARVLRNLDPGLPFAFFGPEPDLETRVAAVHAGASLYLTEPLTGADLLVTLQAFVAAQGPDEARVMILDPTKRFSAPMARSLATEPGLLISVLEDQDKLMEALANARPDLLLIAEEGGPRRGVELCKVLRAHPTWTEIPILLLFDEARPDLRVAAFEAGADDYLSRPILKPELLARIRVRLDRTRLHREQAAMHPLTRLPSRAVFVQQLAERLSAARRADGAFTLAVLEVDQAMELSNLHGPVAHDRVLMGLGRLLAERFRLTDLRGHWSSHQLGLVLVGEEAPTTAAIVRRVQGEFAELAFDRDYGGTFRATFSCGLSSFPSDGAEVEALARVADARLRSARVRGAGSLGLPTDGP